MMSILKAQPASFEISIKGIWVCPHCGHKCSVEYSGNPYVAIADDEVDEKCIKCSNFFQLNFYEKGFGLDYA